MPFFERCFQHGFQFLQRLARRRLRHSHRARRLVQGLVIVERNQQLQLLHAQAR
jgi:beta-lactamase class D